MKGISIISKVEVPGDSKNISFVLFEIFFSKLFIFLVVFLTKREHLEKVESLFRISSLV